MVYAEQLLNRFKGKGLLLDSNLLLLYMVGSFEPSLIGDGKYNKLSKYTVEDHRILVRLKSLFTQTATTPHVLTETSNLAGDLPQAVRSRCFRHFQKAFTNLDELSPSSLAAARRPEFHYLGLTDCVLAELTPSYLVVSDDARLVAELAQSGLEALNFNHLRGYLLHP